MCHRETIIKSLVISEICDKIEVDVELIGEVLDVRVVGDEATTTVI